MKTTIKILSLSLTFLAGAFIGSFAGIPVETGTAFVGARLASSALGVMPVRGVAYDAFDITAIQEYGDDHKRDLIGKLVNGLDIANDILVIPNVKGKMKLTKLTVGDGFRPYSATKEFKTGQLVFSKRELVTQTGKREIQIEHKRFKDTYLALRTSPGNSANRTFNDMEFAPWVWNEIIKNVAREINNETAYFGFDADDAEAFAAGGYAVGDYVTIAVGGVTEYFMCTTIAADGESPITHPAKWRNVTARAVVPGIKSHLDAAITAAQISEVAIGAIASGADAKAGFKELYRSIASQWKNTKLVMHASHTDCEFLLDGIEDLTKYTQPDVSAMVKQGLIPVPATNFNAWVKPASWLGDSRRIIAEPMISPSGMGGNLVMGTDLLSDANDIRTIEELYTLDGAITVDLGFQIQDTDAIWVNDQD